MIEIAAMQSFAEMVLHRVNRYHWTQQGFGMMRTYLDEDHRWRLNVWDHDLVFPGASLIHDHPWHLRSWVLAGNMRNLRYKIVPEGGIRMMVQSLKPGEGGGLLGEATGVRLEPQPLEHYHAGETYYQDFKEIHETAFDAGAVTLNERERPGVLDEARVFWPAGTDWITAEPKEMQVWDVERIAAKALRRIAEDRL